MICYYYSSNYYSAAVNAQRSEQAAPADFTVPHSSASAAAMVASIAVYPLFSGVAPLVGVIFAYFVTYYYYN